MINTGAKENQPQQEIKKPNLQELKELAIYLEGMVKGQGNLHPLGTIHVENLWTTINHLYRQEK